MGIRRRGRWLGRLLNTKIAMSKGRMSQEERVSRARGPRGRDELGMLRDENKGHAHEAG